MKRAVFFSMALLATALLLVSGNAPALGKDIILQGMLHNQFNILDGDKDEIVGTISTRGKKVTAFTWDPKDLDKVFCVTDWGQQIEQLDLAGKKVVRTFRLGGGGVKVRTIDIELNPAHPNLLYALSLRQRWLSDEIVDMTPAVLVLDLTTEKVVKEIEIPRGCTNIFFGYDGSEFYITGRDVFVYDPMTGKQVNFLGLAHPTTTGVDPQISLNIWRQHDQSGMAMILVGSLATANNLPYQGYYTIDLKKKSTEGSMKLVTDIGPLYNQFSAVVSPDRKYYYMVLNKVEKRDFATNQLLATADVDKSYYTIQVSSDGKKVYLGGGGDSILIYDTETMKLLKKLDTPGDAVLTHFRVQHR
ncbi:MAG: quinohemoprotein amine dehydrogenase, beta subunit [Deltaproteobacteria bacterium]|nr:quinohemoprotein amine dehydrogenase, beta subunit [Deltaproteobacteria bacterium]